MGFRDYVGEMRELIDLRTAGLTGYVAIEVAKQLVVELRETDPELLAGWLDAQAEQFIREMITARDRSIRSRQVHVARSAEFGSAMNAAQRTGNTATLTRFLSTPFTVEGEVRKPLGAMNHADLLFVKDEYERRSRENRMYARIMDKLAQTVTTGTVSDHYSEAQLATLFGFFKN